MREEITNTLIKIFRNIGYEVTTETNFHRDIELGMVNVGMLGDEIEYEFGIILSVADLKPIFKGTVSDMIDWLMMRMIKKECD